MKIHYLLALGLAVGTVSNLLGQTPAFTTIDFPGATSTQAWGINPHGDIVGLYTLADNSNHGFLLRGGQFTSIDYPGATSTGAFGINAKGDIAGDYTVNGVLHAFVLSNGHFTNIEFPGAVTTDPGGINSRGEVAGIYSGADKVNHAFLLSGNHFINIDCPNATVSGSNGLNAKGDTVGNCVVGGVTHGWVRSNGKHSLIDVPGAAMTGAYGIDPHGNIVGRYRDPANVTHGFIYSGGSFTTIDVPGATFTGFAAINPAGDIVGRYTLNGVSHGLLLTSPQVSYSVTDLGTLPGGTFSQATFIEDTGVVAGVSDAPDGTQHSVVWQYGQILDIGTPGLGGPNNGVYGLNARGQANGIGETAVMDPNGEDFCGYGTHLQCLAFRWQNGEMTPLPTLGGNNATVGNINKRGEVVGIAEKNTRGAKCSSAQALDFSAVIWGPGKRAIRELQPLVGDTVSVALWINDSGQAVGASGTCDNTGLPPLAGGPHITLWEKDGSVVNLGNLGSTAVNLAAGHANIALAINNPGQVVGTAILKDGAANHAFLWTRGTGMKDLGTLPGDINSAAMGINDRGEIVGISYGAEGPFDGSARPFLWRNGMMTDLSTLIPADSPLFLILPGGINARGEIAGFGITEEGGLHAFQLTPDQRTGSESTAVSRSRAPLSARARKQLQRRMTWSADPNR